MDFFSSEVNVIQPEYHSISNFHDWKVAFPKDQFLPQKMYKVTFLINFN